MLHVLCRQAKVFLDDVPYRHCVSQNTIGWDTNSPNVWIYTTKQNSRHRAHTDSHIEEMVYYSISVLSFPRPSGLFAFALNLCKEDIL